MAGLVPVACLNIQIMKPDLLHFVGSAHAKQIETIGNHLPHGKIQGNASVPDSSILDQNFVGVVVGMKLTSKIPEIWLNFL